MAGNCSPESTPTEIVHRLNEEINAGLADSKVKAHIADLGYSAFTSTPEQFSKFVSNYTAKWAIVIRDAGAPISMASVCSPRCTPIKCKSDLKLDRVVLPSACYERLRACCPSQWAWAEGRAWVLSGLLAA